MQTNIHYVLILDQSGSMYPLKEDIIAMFNKQVETISTMNSELQDTQLKCTLCVFNNEIDFRILNSGVDTLKPLSGQNYKPCSGTALYDAIGITFRQLKEFTLPNDKVYLAIFTDGFENSSTDFTGSDIRQLMAEAELKKWEITFFCRQEEQMFYETNLSMNKNQMKNVSMNKEGIEEMGNHLCYSFRKFVNPCTNFKLEKNKTDFYLNSLTEDIL